MILDYVSPLGYVGIVIAVNLIACLIAYVVFDLLLGGAAPRPKPKDSFDEFSSEQYKTDRLEMNLGDFLEKWRGRHPSPSHVYIQEGDGDVTVVGASQGIVNISLPRADSVPDGTTFRVGAGIKSAKIDWKDGVGWVSAWPVRPKSIEVDFTKTVDLRFDVKDAQEKLDTIYIETSGRVGLAPYPGPTAKLDVVVPEFRAGDWVRHEMGANLSVVRAVVTSADSGVCYDVEYRDGVGMRYEVPECSFEPAIPREGEYWEYNLCKNHNGRDRDAFKWSETPFSELYKPDQARVGCCLVPVNFGKGNNG